MSPLCQVADNFSTTWITRRYRRGNLPRTTPDDHRSLYHGARTSIARPFRPIFPFLHAGPMAPLAEVALRLTHHRHEALLPHHLLLTLCPMSNPTSPDAIRLPTFVHTGGFPASRRCRRPTRRLITLPPLTAVRRRSSGFGSLFPITRFSKHPRTTLVHDPRPLPLHFRMVEAMGRIPSAIGIGARR
jgi:hypothetical protein